MQLDVQMLTVHQAADLRDAPRRRQWAWKFGRIPPLVLGVTVLDQP